MTFDFALSQKYSKDKLINLKASTLNGQKCVDTPLTTMLEFVHSIANRDRDSLPNNENSVSIYLSSRHSKSG